MAGLSDRISRNAKDIKDLYNVATHGVPPTRATSVREPSANSDVSDLMSAIQDLQSELNLKENVADARKTRDDLIDMINR